MRNGARDCAPFCCRKNRAALVGRGTAIAADSQERSMNLVVWLPAMFALGLVSMGVCLIFALACEHI
jgi:hypothetical protein